MVGFQHRCGRFVVAIPVLIGLAAAAPSIAAPLLTLARPTDQARFSVTTFATGLAFPTSMAELTDGSLLVAESDGASLFGSTSGRLVRLIDADGDGAADVPPQVLASGSNLPGLVTSVRRVGDIVIVLSSQTGNEAITFWRTGPTPAAPLTYAGRVGLTFPGGSEHTTYALAARRSPDNPAEFEVYFNVGAAANSVATPTHSTVTLTGSGLTFAPAAVVADSIHRLRVSESGRSLAVSAPQHVARGLRNAAGMTFDGAGNLYLQDNGIDTEGNRGVSFSADELNRIPAATLGHAVTDFGFAGSYVRSADGVLVNPHPALIEPLIAFLPVDGRRSEGAVEIATAPVGFGGDFAGGIFTAFYGMWGQAGTANQENPVVFADPASGQYFHFVNNQVHGHPSGMLATAASLFVTDLGWTGSLDETIGGVPANEAGVIYRIAPVPEPAGLILAGIMAAALGGLHSADRHRGAGCRKWPLPSTSTRSSGRIGCPGQERRLPRDREGVERAAIDLDAGPAVVVEQGIALSFQRARHGRGLLLAHLDVDHRPLAGQDSFGPTEDERLCSLDIDLQQIRSGKMLHQRVERDSGHVLRVPGAARLRPIAGLLQ